MIFAYEMSSLAFLKKKMEHHHQSFSNTSLHTGDMMLELHICAINVIKLSTTRTMFPQLQRCHIYDFQQFDPRFPSRTNKISSKESQTGPAPK